MVPAGRRSPGPRATQYFLESILETFRGQSLALQLLCSAVIQRTTPNSFFCEVPVQ